MNFVLFRPRRPSFELDNTLEDDEGNESDGNSEGQPDPNLRRTAQVLSLREERHSEEGLRPVELVGDSENKRVVQ